MHWIIQTNIYSEEGHDQLIEAMDRLGLPHTLHKCVPFVGTLDPEPQPTQDKVIVMGSYTLAKKAQELGWTPGAFINENFNYFKQVQHWGDHMINSDAIFCKLKYVEDINEGFLQAPFFIRPIHDTKDFSGKVMDLAEFTEWMNGIKKLTPEDGATVTGDTDVMVSPVKKIFAEYRTWIIKGKVVTSSQYKFGQTKRFSADVPPAVVKFAEDRATEWSPAPAYCLDVFDTEDGLKIGEVNNLNSAGFYKADMNRLVQALEEAFG